MDAVRPLAYILKEAQKSSLTAESAVNAAKAALRFLGNASAHIAQERRRRVLKELNRDLEGLAEDEDGEFAEAAPLLFGDGFAKKSKEHIENVRALRKTTSKPPRGQFFRESRPYNSRGGGSNQRNYFRGGRSSGAGNYRGRNRFQPYPGKPYQGKDRFQQQKEKV